MEIAQQIAYYLFYLELGTYDEEGINGNIFIDILPEINNSIAIYNKGGVSPHFKAGYREINIQILFKGDKDSINSFKDAKNIFEALLERTGKLLDFDEFNYIVGFISNQSQPQHIGLDKNGNHEYSMNFSIEYT